MKFGEDGDDGWQSAVDRSRIAPKAWLAGQDPGIPPSRQSGTQLPDNSPTTPRRWKDAELTTATSALGDTKHLCIKEEFKQGLIRG